MGELIMYPLTCQPVTRSLILTYTMQPHMAYFKVQLHMIQAYFLKSMISGINVIHAVLRHVFLLFKNIFLRSAS